MDVNELLVTHGGSYPAGGNYNHEDDDDLNGAAAAAAQHGGNEDRGFFSDILNQIGQNKSSIANQGIDETGMSHLPWLIALSRPS